MNTRFIPVCDLPQLDFSPQAGALVLVVDDEPVMRSVMTLILESNCYRVIVAEDGLDALALFSQYRGQVALVITDLMMPNLDGAALTRELKRLEPNLNIIALSGSVIESELVASLAPDLFAFLTKPFQIAVFLQAVGAGVASSYLLNPRALNSIPMWTGQSKTHHGPLNTDPHEPQRNCLASSHA